MDLRALPVDRREDGQAWKASLLWSIIRAMLPAMTAGLVRAGSLCPLEPPEAYKAVPRRVRGLNGQIRSR